MKTQNEFANQDLPEWAQAEPAVVWAAEHNAGFRIAVCSADTEYHRQILVRLAREAYTAWLERKVDDLLDGWINGRQQS